MAIALDDESVGRSSTGSSVTVSHAVGAGADRVMIALTTVQDSNHANYPVTSVVFNGGESLTKIREDEAVGNVGTSIWYLINPTNVTANVVATFTGPLGEMTLGVITITGAKQSAQPDANNGATGNSSGPTLSLTTVADNSWSFTVCAAEASFSSVDNGQTVITGYPQTDQSYENADTARKAIATAAATTLGYTIGWGAPWSLSAASFLPTAVTTFKPKVMMF